MGKLEEKLTKAIEDKVQQIADAFSDGLVEDDDHPVLTGITRGNWHPSTNKPLKKELRYGFSDADWFDAVISGDELVSLSEAKQTSRIKDWKLGDTLLWTNSLEHIGDLEFRRKFFDQIVDNARQKAQRAARRGK